MPLKGSSAKLVPEPAAASRAHFIPNLYAGRHGRGSLNGGSRGSWGLLFVIREPWHDGTNLGMFAPLFDRFERGEPDHSAFT